MYTVSQLLGISKNNGRGLVIYLSNSIGRASDSWQSFERMLGRLGRNLRTAGTVVVAFDGADDAIAGDVLRKPWDENQRAAISRRPGLLIIDKDFDNFDPTVDSHFHIDLRRLSNAQGTLNEELTQDLIAGLNDVFLSEQEMFHMLNDISIVMRRERALGALSIKPSFYGIGIDVVELVRALRDR